MPELPGLGRVYSARDLESLPVLRLIHLPTVVSAIKLPEGGVIPTASNRSNIDVNAGDFLVWGEDGRFWIVESEHFQYCDFDSWKEAVKKLIESTI